MGIIGKIEAGYAALQAGKQLVRSETWASRANLVSVLTALITASIGLARGFGYDIHVDGTDIASIALGLGTLGTLVSSIIHTASNPNAGRQPPAPPRPVRPARR